jgi:hypothetical protein
VALSAEGTSCRAHAKSASEKRVVAAQVMGEADTKSTADTLVQLGSDHEKDNQNQTVTIPA